MPITPEEGRQYRMKLAAPEAASLHDKIDKRLREQPSPVLVAVGQLKEEVFKNIVNTYYNKLWTVTRDQTNPGTLVFTERRAYDSSDFSGK